MHVLYLVIIAHILEALIWTLNFVHGIHRYTFSVTAKFDNGGQNFASTTLLRNYVSHGIGRMQLSIFYSRFLLLLVSSCMLSNRSCSWMQPPHGGFVRVMDRNGTENVYRGVRMKNRYQIVAQGW